MEAVAFETGLPSKVTTNARRFARQGAVILAELLEHCSFADTSSVIIDWDDSFNRQPEGAAKPVMYVVAVKEIRAVEVNPFVRVEVRLDIEDLFGNDNITAENLVGLVSEMETSMNEAIAKRMAQ